MDSPARRRSKWRGNRLSLVQNDGANTAYFGQNLANTLADDISHFGSPIVDRRFCNEDGDANRCLSDVEVGLNDFIKGSTRIIGPDAASLLNGTDGADQIIGQWNADTIEACAGEALVKAGYGNDLIRGGDGNDILLREGGSDSLDRHNGSDTYQVSGNQAGGWSRFAGFDTFADTGASGTDRIVATGTDVDIGLRGLTALGNVVVDGASGDDRLIGGTSNDVLGGGNGNDLLVGNQGLACGHALIGGAGNDRLALAYNDHSAVDIRGGSLSGKDGSADLITLVGTRGALAFSATVLDFEVGKDRIDLSQLRDAGNNVMAFDDLLISTGGGNIQIGFAAGVHTMDGGSIDVQITLVGVTGVSASAFSLGAPTLPWGLAALDTALGYL